MKSKTKILLSACLGAIIFLVGCPGEETDKSDSVSPRKQFSADGSSIYFLEAAASVPGAAWSRAGDESLVVEILLNGAPVGYEIIHGGVEAMPRLINLGNLPPGEMVVSAKVSELISPAEARPRWKKFEVVKISRTDPLFMAAKFAPALSSPAPASRAPIPSFAYNDSPILLASRIGEVADGRRIEYIALSSDSDYRGDLGVAAQARIDGGNLQVASFYRVTLDSFGDPISREYLADDNLWAPLADSDSPLFEPADALWRVRPARSQSQTHYYFHPAPATAISGDEILSAIPASFGWLYSLAEEELLRDGEIRTSPVPNELQAGPADEYIRIAYRIESEPENIPFYFEAKSLLGDYNASRSDGDSERHPPGDHSAAVEVGGGIDLDQLESVKIRLDEDIPPGARLTIKRALVYHVDRNFKTTILADFVGDIFIDAKSPIKTIYCYTQVGKVCDDYDFNFKAKSP